MKSLSRISHQILSAGAVRMGLGPTNVDENVSGRSPALTDGVITDHCFGDACSQRVAELFSNLRVKRESPRLTPGARESQNRRHVTRLSFILVGALVLGPTLRAQNAVTQVDPKISLINDPAPFYTTALINGERRLISVRFTNLGSDVKVVVDPILRFGPDSNSTLGDVFADCIVSFPDPDEWEFDPWDVPDPIDDIPLPDPIDGPDPFDDLPPFPDPPPFPDVDLDPGPFDPIDLEPIDIGGEPLGYVVGPVAEAGDASSKDRNAVVLESDEQGFDPPLRDIDIIISDYRGSGIQRLQPGPGARVLGNISTGANPLGVAYSRDRSTAYVANAGPSTISIIKGNSIAGTISLPSTSVPSKMVLTSRGRAYVTDLNRFKGAVMVVDLANRTLVTSIPVGLYPAGLALTGDGAQLWVTSLRDNNVTVIDTATNQALGQVPNIPKPRGIHFNRAGTLAYVVSSTNNAVYMIDAATWTVKGMIEVGKNPREIRLSPSGHHLFVTNKDSGDITQISTRTNKVVRNIAVGGTPIGTYFIPTR